MKAQPKPMRTTIGYGVIAAAGLFPLITLLNRLLPGAPGFHLVIWLYLAVYAALLSWWGGRAVAGITLPLILLLIPVIWIIPLSAYLLFCLASLSWIRSGLCFRDRSAGRFAAEAVLCLGGGVAIAGFQPHTTISWSLGILMFFLIQAIYFIFFRVPGPGGRVREVIDPFDTARRAAEEIISQNS